VISPQSILRIACGLCASFFFLGAATQPPGSMYLRLSNTRTAPVVANLSYDAVATVPQSPRVSLALLPVDQVQGSMIIANGSATRRIDRSDFKGVSSFTVVQVDTDGNVVQRTTFKGITIESVDPVGDGSTARRVRFVADSVSVSVPSKKA
jgi:hypothetical protein